MTFLSKLLVLAGTVTLSALIHAAPEGWTSDFDGALRKAEKEKKNLLIDFTGSDWCGWCIKLDKEVFSTDLFKKEAPKKYIPVYIDFPRDKSKMSEQEIERNNQLAQVFKVNGYPTILVINGKGNVLARTGYQPGGPEAYLKHLDEKIAAGQAFQDLIASANSLKGVEKAKQLDKALEKLDEKELSEQIKVMKEIMSLDKDNKVGLKGKYAFQAELKPFFISSMKKFESDSSETLTKLNSLSQDPAQKEQFEKEKAAFQKKLAKFMGTISARLAEIDNKYKFKGKTRQQYCGILANSYSMQQKWAEVVEVLKDGIKADPESEQARIFESQITGIKQQYLNKQESKEKSQ